MLRSLISLSLAALRRGQTALAVAGKSNVEAGPDLHIGRGTRLWAPDRILIGRNVYIGKDVHIEANCEIGDFCLISNRVGIIGRHDHDFRTCGLPIRYAPWIGSRKRPIPAAHRQSQVTIEGDCWVGYGAIVLTGARIGKGSIVAAGSVVSGEVPPYSIVAGVPARVIGQRFDDTQSILRHEAAIQRGHFALSERGYDHCVIEPATTAQE